MPPTFLALSPVSVVLAQAILLADERNEIERTPVCAVSVRLLRVALNRRMSWERFGKSSRDWWLSFSRAVRQSVRPYLELVVELGAANLFDHFFHHVFVLVVRCVAAFLGAHEGRSPSAKVKPRPFPLSPSLSVARSLPLSRLPHSQNSGSVRVAWAPPAERECLPCECIAREKRKRDERGSERR